MYSHRYRALLGSALVLWLAGCATTRISTDYDREASFRQLRTYDWTDVTVASNGSNGRNGSYGSNGSLDVDSGEPTLSPLLARYILRAVDAELASRGYHKTSSGAPDFRITYRVEASERVSVSPGYGGFGYGGFGYGRFGHGRFGHGHFGHGHFGHGFGHGHFGRSAFYGPYYAPARSVREYLRTTLILDVFDARSGELIWRGWARSDLGREPTPERFQEYVDQAVHKILKRFPPET